MYYLKYGTFEIYGYHCSPIGLRERCSIMPLKCYKKKKKKRLFDSIAPSSSYCGVYTLPIKRKVSLNIPFLRSKLYIDYKRVVCPCDTRT